jgi:hypothetical protein
MLAAGCFVLLLQFARPEISTLPVVAEFDAPADVKRILRRSCYDCHSNETRLAWFDRIVPASWLVARDVRRAREHLNFSQLGTEPKSRQKAVLFEAVNQIQMGAMPLVTYARMHPESAISPVDLAVLRNYLLPLDTKQPSAPSANHKADDQYRNWLSTGSKGMKVKNSPNGIAFLPDYRNWTVISTTERSDTNTLKAILGNDVAVATISRNDINPWPDGTIFAKVSWQQLSREDGEAHAGEFLQVAFMIKNRAKYASTAGWGWAEWLGSELTPFGKDANFASQCVACHLPLRQNDYVFTFPIAPSRESE